MVALLLELATSPALVRSPLHARWAQLATLSTKVAALKNLQEKDTSQ